MQLLHVARVNVETCQRRRQDSSRAAASPILIREARVCMSGCLLTDWVTGRLTGWLTDMGRDRQCRSTDPVIVPVAIVGL